MNFPSIKDNPIFYLGLLVTIEQAIGQGTVSLTNVVPGSWTPYITSWCTLLAFVGTAIMTALAAPGRAPAAVAKVVGWIAVVGLGLALLAGPAPAQQGERGNVWGPQVKLPIPLSRPAGADDPATGSLLDKPFRDLANFIGDDIDSAIKLSTSVPSLQDGNGQQCLMALKTFSEVIKAHPAPLTFKIASDLEAFRLKQMAVNKLCGDVHCTQVFGDFTNTVQAASPIPLPVPSLHDLCSKVPQIAAAAPVEVPPSTPAAPAPAK